MVLGDYKLLLGHVVPWGTFSIRKQRPALGALLWVLTDSFERGWRFEIFVGLQLGGAVTKPLRSDPISKLTRPYTAEPVNDKKSLELRG
jgi:hypothetical protein